MKRDVSISCATDHNYFCGTLVTLHSLCAHAASVQSLRLHILDSGLTEADRATLSRLQEAFPEKTITVQFHQVDLRRFSSLPPWRGGYAAYARMCLHELLPDEDFTVYTDVDTLWLRDVGELWDKRDASVVLHAVPDGCGLRWYSSGIQRAQVFEKQGITIQPEYYFCSGLLLMNLALMRDDRFTERYFNLLKHQGGDWLTYPDQDLYNVLYPVPITQLLDFRWGEFPIAYGLRGMSLPRVFHYVKGAPWKRETPLSLVTMLWWQYLKEKVGFESLGADAKRFERRYRALDLTFGLGRHPLGRYLTPSLLNSKLFRKSQDRINPAQRDLPLPLDVITPNYQATSHTIRVIIPFYNAEKTLRETLISVQMQTFTNWECVCVNDGSTDTSAAIVREVMAQDSRFSLIEQANVGPGVARNAGMRDATTTWLFFLDADDTLHPKLFETLLGLVNDEADCIGANFTRDQDALSIEGNVEYVDKPGETYFKAKAPRTELICFRLWRRTAIGGLEFQPWKNHEDTAWNLQMQQRLRSSVFLDAPAVFYRPSEGSPSVSSNARVTLPRLWRFLAQEVPASRASLTQVAASECNRAYRTQDVAFLQAVAQLKREGVLDFHSLPLSKRFRLWRMGVRS